MSEPSKQTNERELAEIVAKFHLEQQGHSPLCSSNILPSMAIVRSERIFTSTERNLSESPEGRKIIQSARREQRALTRREIESRVAKLLNRKVLRSYYDLDVRAGEQVEIYIFD
jgi:uncharacterized protein YbcI